MTGKQLRQWRDDQRLSQEGLAKHLGISQATLSRLEASAADLPEHISRSIENMKSDQPNSAAFAVGRSLGGLANRLAPENFLRGLASQLKGEATPPTINRADPRGNDKLAACRAGGAHGVRTANSYERILADIEGARWEDIINLYRDYLEADMATSPEAARPMDVKNMHNYALALTEKGLLDEAEEALRVVQAHPAADARDRAIAGHQLGDVLLRRVRSAAALDAPTRELAIGAERAFVEASRVIGPHRSTVVSLYQLANALERFGDRLWTNSLVAQARTIASELPPDDLAEIRNPSWRRRVLPALSRRPGLFVLGLAASALLALPGPPEAQTMRLANEGMGNGSANAEELGTSTELA